MDNMDRGLRLIHRRAQQMLQEMPPLFDMTEIICPQCAARIRMPYLHGGPSPAVFTLSCSRCSALMTVTG